MTRWQKRARLGVAVIGVGALVAVVYTRRPREAREAAPPIERLDPNATVETRGGDVIQLKGTRQDLRVEFQGQVTYRDGQTKLIDVKVTADNRGGRNFVITGHEAQVGKDQSSFDITGNVMLQASDGFTVWGEKASYTDEKKIVDVPGRVKFARGRMAGTGVGMTYDQQRDLVSLADQAEVHFAPEGEAGPMDVTAGAFTFGRGERYMRFERTLHMVREGQVIDAAEATVHLLADRDEPDLIELRGDASIAGGTGLGQLQSMSARDINLDYADDGRTLQRATLAANAAVQMAGQGGAQGQRIAADWMDVTLKPDGSVSDLASRDNVQVSLPATRDTGARAIRSTSLKAVGAAKGLSSMRFDEGVTYNEAATRAHAARTARARSLEASLVPDTGALDEARFAGGFVFEDGTLRAESAQATYAIAAGTLALGGSQGGRPPQLADPNLTLNADAIDVTLSPRSMTAKGNVRSVLQPSGKGGDKGARRPGLLGAGDPVNVIADSLTYDESTRRAEYKGSQARLFQGDTAIYGDTIVLDETKGDLSATGKAVTTLVIADKGAAPGAKTTPTVVRAATFTYSDQARQATYETGAQMNGAQGDLRANRIDLFLGADDNALRKLGAAGAVRATVDKRLVTGARLDYDPNGDKYVVTGAPVKMVDADCRETTGKTLTFFKASDRVLVDGNEEVRTQTKGGGTCTPPPSH